MCFDDFIFLFFFMFNVGSSSMLILSLFLQSQKVNKMPVVSVGYHGRPGLC